MSEASLIAAAQTNTRRTSWLDHTSQEESCGTEQPQATESASPNELGSDNWEQFRGESLLNLNLTLLDWQPYIPSLAVE